MKASLVAASLLTLAAAQPHGHAQFHKRQAVETDVTYVTAAPVVDYVCVDDDGNSLPCPAEAQAAPAPNYGGAAPAPAATPAPAAPAPASPAPASPAPAGNTGAGAGVGAGASGTGSSSAPASGSTGGSGNNNGSGSSNGSVPTQMKGLGIAYSPYNSDQSCKTADQVMADFNTIKGYGSVRIYNTDCNQAATVSAAARANGMEVMAGIFKINNVAGDIQSLIGQLNSNWDGINTVVIGNELVNSKSNSVDEVIAAIGTARGLLRGAGFQGPVITVDTNNVILDLDPVNNPHPDGYKLCTASDYCAFNAHPFFAPVAAQDSGSWARDQVSQAVQKTGGQRVVIAECGWPSGGDANGPAVPSPENQKAVVSAIHAEFSSDMYMFTAFNDYWKAPGAFNSEQFWGIMGNSNQ